MASVLFQHAAIDRDAVEILRLRQGWRRRLMAPKNSLEKIEIMKRAEAGLSACIFLPG